MKMRMCDKSAKVTKVRNLWAVLVVTTLISGSGHAQHQGYRAVADLTAFKKQFTAGSVKVGSI